jgi:threonine synthase
MIPRASRHTISNAMDVGNPSNFARIVDLYDNDLQAIRRDIWGCSFQRRRNACASCTTSKQRTAMCSIRTPPSACSDGRAYAKQNHAAAQGIVLATAHPAKFGETVARAIGVRPEMPERLAAFLDRPKKSIPISQPIFRASGISSILQHLILWLMCRESNMRLFVGILGLASSLRHALGCV